MSDFLLDLHQSLAYQGFATDFSKIGLDISMGMPDEDPEPFSGWFSQIPMHQDLSTYLRKKSLNLGLNLDFGLLIPYMIKKILASASFRFWQMTPPTSTRRFARPGPERPGGEA